jgi:hypothetical protein
MRLGGHELDVGEYTGGALRRAEIIGVVQQHPVRAGLWAAANCCPALASVVSRVGIASGFDPILCGEAVANLLIGLGASMTDLETLALLGVQRLTPAARTQPEPAQAPARPIVDAGPYAGLRLWGKTYAEWGRTARPDRERAERLTWADCGRAIDDGTIAEVVAHLNADGVPAVWEG